MSMGTQWLQHYIFIFIAGYRPTLHTSIWGFYCIVHIFDHKWADDTVIHMEGINEYGVLLIKLVKLVREAGYTIATANHVWSVIYTKHWLSETFAIVDRQL